MKKALALTLSLLMIVASFAGCGNNGDLVNAKDYLIGMYQTGNADEAMTIGVDKDVLSVVTVDGVSYDVEWAITITQGSADSVKIAESTTANCVKIDVPEMSEEEILFTATATVKDKKNSETAVFLYKVDAIVVEEPTTEDTTVVEESTTAASQATTTKAPTTTKATGLTLVKDQDKILKDAFALGKNETTPYIAQLTGKVISIDKEYNAQYGSVSVLINVGEKNILCWQMKGTGADVVKPGDTITVTGVIKNFYYDVNDASGKVEFTYDEATKTEVKLISLVPGQEVVKDLAIVANPQVGVAYKFGFFSTAKNATYYAVGGMSGYYMATSTSPAAAIDVYLENADGGYYLYAMIGGKKQYMNMEVSGTHLNAVYRDTASTVYTYDTAKQTLVASIDRGADKGVKEQAFGTYDNYVTIGTTYTDKDSYFCHFYA